MLLSLGPSSKGRSWGQQSRRCRPLAQRGCHQAWPLMIFLFPPRRLMTSERAQIRLRPNETRGGKRRLEVSVQRGVSGFGGVSAFCTLTTSSHPWKSPSAHQRPVSVKEEMEHPEGHRGMGMFGSPPPKLLSKHQKTFPLHTVKLWSRGDCSVLSLHGIEASDFSNVLDFQRGIPIPQPPSSAEDGSPASALR